MLTTSTLKRTWNEILRFINVVLVLSIDCYMYFDTGLSTNTMNGILNIYDFVICSGISLSEITAHMFVKLYFRQSQSHSRTSSFMTCHHVCNKSNLTGITSQAGPAYPSEAHDFTLVFCEIRIAQFFVFSVMLYRSLYVPFLLAIESHRWCNGQRVRLEQIVGSSPDRIKPKTIQLVFVASPLSTQYQRENIASTKRTSSTSH